MRKVHYLLFFTACACALSYLTSTHILNPQMLHGFKTGDPEINSYIAYVVKSGGGFYSDYSISYGPGRYILVAIVYALVHVDYSITVFNLYFLVMLLIIYPAALTTVCYLFLRTNGFKYKFAKIVNPLIAVSFGLSYLYFFRGGQDGHLSLLLIIGIYSYYALSPRDLWALLLGLGLGMVAFFRVELAIVVATALVLVELYYALAKDEASVSALVSSKLTHLRCFLLGFGGFSLTYFLLLMLHGSITNFLHDIFLLGFVAQPQQMGLPIARSDKLMFTLFLGLNVFMVFVTGLSQNKHYVFVTLLNMLIYVSALGRSDFSHLVYSLVLFPVAALVTLLGSREIVLQNAKYGSITESIKGQGSVYLLLSAAVTVLGITICIRQTISKESIFLLLLLASISLGGSILFSGKHAKPALAFATLVVIVFVGVHNSAIKKYFKSTRFALQIISPAHQRRVISDFKSEATLINFAGDLIIPPEELAVFNQIKQDLAGSKSIFVYPSNVTLYAELRAEKPTRYTFFSGEYTGFMQEETISELKNKQIKYVLYFANFTRSERTRIDDYITTYYEKIASYISPTQGQIYLLQVR
jgi:hypothetical protein